MKNATAKALYELAGSSANVLLNTVNKLSVLDDAMTHAVWRAKQAVNELYAAAAIVKYGVPRIEYRSFAGCRIIDFSTGESYSSAAACAAGVGMSRQSIYSSMSRGGSLGAYVDGKGRAIAFRAVTGWVVSVAPDVSVVFDDATAERMMGCRSPAEILHRLGRQLMEGGQQ